MTQQISHAKHYTAQAFYDEVKMMVNKRVWGDQYFKEEVVQHICERQCRNGRLSQKGIKMNRAVLRKEIVFAVGELLRRGIQPNQRQDTEHYDEQIHLIPYEPDLQLGIVNLMDLENLKQHLLTACEEQLNLVKTRTAAKDCDGVNTPDEAVMTKRAFLTECIFAGDEKQEFLDIAEKYCYQSSNPCINYQHFIKQVFARFETYTGINVRQWLDDEALYLKKGVVALLLKYIDALLVFHEIGESEFDRLAC